MEETLLVIQNLLCYDKDKELCIMLIIIPSPAWSNTGQKREGTSFKDIFLFGVEQQKCE